MCLAAPGREEATPGRAVERAPIRLKDALFARKGHGQGMDFPLLS